MVSLSRFSRFSLILFLASALLVVGSAGNVMAYMTLDGNPYPTAITTKTQDVYPNYEGDLNFNLNIAYEPPNFGTLKPVWVRQFNTPNSSAGLADPYWIGQVDFDSLLMVDYQVEQDDEYYVGNRSVDITPTYEELESQLFDYKIAASDTVKDSRLTAWWQSKCLEDYNGVFNAVQACAVSQDNKLVTTLIIKDMSLKGFLPKGTEKLSSAEVKAIMRRYTEAGLIGYYRWIVSRLPGSKLDLRFVEFGSLVLDYYDPAHGPCTTPYARYVILSQHHNKSAYSVMDEGGSLQTLDFLDHQEFIRVQPPCPVPTVAPN